MKNYHEVNDPEAKNDYHWRQIFDSSVQGYCLIDKNHNVFDVNTAFTSILGLSKEEILGKKCFEIYDGKLCNTPDCLVKRIFEGENNPFLAREIAHCNGTRIPCIISARPYVDEQGNIMGIIQEVNDISTRKQPVPDFTNNLSKFAIYMSQSPDGIFVVNTDGFIVDANSSGCEMLGYATDELLKLHISDIDVNLKDADEFKMSKPSGKIIEDERVLRKKNGTDIIVHIKSVALGNNMYIFYMRDNTQRRLTEQTLSETEKRFKLYVDESPYGIFVVNENGRYIDVNPAACELLGYTKDELLQRSIREITISDDELESFIKLQESGEILVEEKTLVKKDGTYVIVELQAVALEQNRYMAYVTDITEKKVMHEELSRLERLNLIGQMSVGIGHELRNPMTTVRGFIQMLGSWETDSKKKEYYDIMIEELDRANSIITEFLSLAKNKTVNLKPYCLNTILNSLYPLISTDAIRQDKNVVLKNGEIPNILVDEKELRQLILNLVNNGLEAMSAGGTLTLGTYKEIDEVVLYVQDQGHGIDIEILEKLGNPFVTTKENGTGLGLAICYSIANRHNARIDTKTGAFGTTFSVRFKLPKHIREVS